MKIFKFDTYFISSISGGGTAVLCAYLLPESWYMFISMISGMLIGMLVLIIVSIFLSWTIGLFELMMPGMFIVMLSGMFSSMKNLHSFNLLENLIFGISLAISIQFIFNLYDSYLYGAVKTKAI